MVALKPQQIEGFLKSPDLAVKLVLIYGADAGMANERARTLATVLANSGTEPGEILQYDDADIAEDRERLTVELMTKPMFGGANVVRLKAGQKLRPDVIAALLDYDTIEGYLIVEAGNLKRDAKLRKLFESSKSAIALPCYPDDLRSLEGMVDEVVGQANLKISTDARALLVGLLGADRAVSRAELDKLVLYAGDDDEITPQHIEDIVGDASEIGLDRICLLTASGKTSDALRQLDRTLAGDAGAQAVLIALNRYYDRLLQVHRSMQAGKSLEDAMRGLRPPVHFKLQREFSAQCRQHSRERLQDAQMFIRETIARTRRASSLETQLVERLLLNLARLAVRA